MKVLVLGAGNMGLTYAEGMANSPFLNKRKLMIFDVSPQKTEALSTMA
ncbi:MAG: pyrroline-5-carboxylate reductase, partial [Bacteroidota bacterium]|nr:pyrroline-5-carboxylate reductase [Bacteroidota bacterium]